MFLFILVKSQYIENNNNNVVENEHIPVIE